jgi:hypothetical protein
MFMRVLRLSEKRGFQRAEKIFFCDGSNGRFFCQEGGENEGGDWFGFPGAGTHIWEKPCKSTKIGKKPPGRNGWTPPPLKFSAI